MDEQPDSDSGAGLARALNASVDAAEHLTETDQAIVELGRTVARLLDQGADAVKLTPIMVSVLDALALTPKARARGSKAATSGGLPTSPIDELRERRRARITRTEAMDATATGPDT